ncbi:hypothetical protein BDV96DRAFT_563361 [Lophiotrema nucula]|uniref:Uncharacterized protein n=1 Tax=Lophiotrema nucula TaxID=690887 RepID=A0A6A5ZRM8_9PLEO|nr:hypothetical protein BDV96DRAFT_563361 [Lophiotrema nucula]
MVCQETILPPSVTVIYGRFTAPLRMYADAAHHLELYRRTCCKDVLPVDDKQFACLGSFSKQMLTIAQSARMWQNNERSR